jgi:ribonuclease R
VSSLERDYYHRDPSGTKLVGERTGTTYGLTDRMRVRLAGVNLEERKIDFMLVESGRAQSRAGSRRRRG